MEKRLLTLMVLLAIWPSFVSAHAEIISSPMRDIVQSPIKGIFQSADEAAPVIAYGVIWNSATDTYQVGTLEGGVFTEEAIAEFPIQDKMKRCLLADNGSVNYYLSATDSTKKADGVTASDLTGRPGR